MGSRHLPCLKLCLNPRAAWTTFRSLRSNDRTTTKRRRNVTLPTCLFFVAAAMVHEDSRDSLVPLNKVDHWQDHSHRSQIVGRKREEKFRVTFARARYRLTSLSSLVDSRHAVACHVDRLVIDRGNQSFIESRCVSLIRRRLSRISGRCHSHVATSSIRSLHATRFPESHSFRLRWWTLERRHAPSTHVNCTVRCTDTSRIRREIRNSRSSLDVTHTRTPRAIFHDVVS